MILTGQRDLVAAFVASRIRDTYTSPQRDFEAIGVVRDGKLIGGVVYSNYHEIAPSQHDIMLTSAGDPGWLTRGAIKVLIGYPFEQLACIRLTSIISKANKPARELNERLGFKLEGKIRHGRGIGKDCLVYGLLKEDANKWLK